MEHTELRQFAKSLNLDYMVTFVPFSMSRSAKPVKSVSDYSINWKVFLKNGRSKLETDYMQGIGHLPEALRVNFGRVSVDQFKAVREACETGKTRLRNPLKKPDLLDVLYCLVMDSDVLNCASFEDWADNFGHDADSMQANETYKACLQNALSLRAMIGNDSLEKLSELYNDY